MAGDAVILAVIRIPFAFAPYLVIGELGHGILNGARFCAELLSQLCRARGADIGAFTAGNALVRVNMGTVRGGGKVGSVEVLARSDRTAGAEVAVANAVDLRLWSLRISR